MNIFKKSIFGLMIALSSLSFADVSLSGNIAITTDYIWRGMTQNAGDPSVSGGFDLEDDSGFTWVYGLLTYLLMMMTLLLDQDQWS